MPRVGLDLKLPDSQFSQRKPEHHRDGGPYVLDSTHGWMGLSLIPASCLVDLEMRPLRNS